MEYKVLDWTWRDGTIGIVAVEYENGKYWQAYIKDTKNFITPNGLIGILAVRSEDDGVKFVAELGDKLNWMEAQAFFPHLDIKKYKTYSDGQ